MDASTNRFEAAIHAFRSNQAHLKERGFSNDANKLDWMELSNAVVHVGNSHAMHLDEHLTYYCTTDVAEKIIGGGFLWLTDIHKMNDTSELDFATKYLLERCRKLASKSTTDSVLRVLYESITHWIDSPTEWNDTKIYSNKLILAMCLSSHSDELTMWREYGDKGHGAAIHFHARGLHRAVRSASQFNVGSGSSEMGLVKVCYPDPVCDCLERLMEEVMVAYQLAISSVERDLLRNLLHAEALRLLVGHKNPSFSAEKEIRIFALTTAEKTWAGSDKTFRFDNGKRSFHYSTICLPHQALNVSSEDFWASLISGVTLGPCAADDSHAKLHNVLALRGHNGYPQISHIPMRCS